MKVPPKPEPGLTEREAAARMVDAAASEVAALRKPRVTVRASGVVLQVLNIAPDYDMAHVVVVDVFGFNPWGPFEGLLAHRYVPDAVMGYLMIGAWERRN